MLRAVVLVAIVAGCGRDTAPPQQPPTTTPTPPTTAPPGGRVETKRFASAALGVEKNYVIYLPSGYDAAPDRRWPVYYYLHGLTRDETMFTASIELEATANKLGVQAIIVMPDGDDSFYVNAVTPYDYDACMKNGSGLFLPGQPRATTCVKKRAYEDYIVKDLIAHVDTTYRTIASRDGRGIAGISMGGYGALMLGLRHPDLFAAAASHSGVDSLLYAEPHPYKKGAAVLATDMATWGKDLGEFGAWMRGIYGADLANWQAHDPPSLVAKRKTGLPAIYLECGTEDEFHLQDGMQYLHDVLLEHGIEHAYFIGPGKHDAEFWKPRLFESLKFLAEKVARPK
jgi:S-formylglutathione hydrolase FrmB